MIVLDVGIMEVSGDKVFDWPGMKQTQLIQSIFRVNHSIEPEIP